MNSLLNIAIKERKIKRLQGHWDIRLNLSWKLAILVPAGAMQAAGGEKSSTVVFNCKPYELQ